mgnify:FL=1
MTLESFLSPEIIVLDTETTGLSGYPRDKIVDIAMISLNTKTFKYQPIYNSLITYPPEITKDFTNAWIFKNTDLQISDLVHGKPEVQVAKECRSLLSDHTVTSFNTDFDFGKFLQYQPWCFPDPLFCIMQEATAVCQIRVPYKRDYKFPSLIEAHSMLCNGRKFDQPHRALGDALGATEVLITLLKRNIVKVL